MDHVQYLLVLGTCALTYGWTRYSTTEAVTTGALAHTTAFLQEQGFYPKLAPGPNLELTPERQIAGKKLIGSIYLVGGLKHWHNQAIPICGLGSVLFLAGLFVPFVRVERRLALSAR